RIILGSNSSIGVTGASDTLTIGGPITDNNVPGGYSVTKVGLGTMTYASPTSNTYTGLTQVNTGVLQLNSGGTAVAGNLTIGTGTGSPATAVVRELLSSQIGSSNTV